MWNVAGGSGKYASGFRPARRLVTMALLPGTISMLDIVTNLPVGGYPGSVRWNPRICARIRSSDLEFRIPPNRSRKTRIALHASGDGQGTQPPGDLDRWRRVRARGLRGRAFSTLAGDPGARPHRGRGLDAARRSTRPPPRPGHHARGGWVVRGTSGRGCRVGGDPVRAGHGAETGGLKCQIFLPAIQNSSTRALRCSWCLTFLLPPPSTGGSWGSSPIREPKRRSTRSSGGITQHFI